MIQTILCPYCKRDAQFVDSAIIYGISYGMIYHCRGCDAYVGVHKETNRPLGSLANAELRKARKKAHSIFDPLWQTGSINAIWSHYMPKITNRDKAYLWLSKQMNINKEKCHIAMFNEDQCKQAIEIVEQAVRSL